MSEVDSHRPVNAVLIHGQESRHPSGSASLRHAHSSGTAAAAAPAVQSWFRYHREKPKNLLLVLLIRGSLVQAHPEAP